MKPLNAFRSSLFVLIVLHAVGAIGILAGFAPLLLPLSAVNLLIAAAILVGLSRNQWSAWWLLAPLGGFIAEVAGVQTGLLFGAYSYGSSLGPCIGGVPLMLGPLWLMMLWGSWSLIHRLKLQAKPKLPNILLSAAIMTALDGLIEPVAIRAGWWTWHNEMGTVPWTNYASWFGIAALLLSFAPAPKRDEGTSIASALFLIFTVFFTLLNLFPWTP